MSIINFKNPWESTGVLGQSIFQNNSIENFDNKENAQNQEHYFQPEDVVKEMIGKSFFLIENTTFEYKNGHSFIVNASVPIQVIVWDNDKIHIKAKVPSMNEVISVKKRKIKPYISPIEDISPYYAGVKEQIKTVEESVAKTTSHIRRKKEFQKFNNLKDFKTELDNQKKLLKDRYKELNRRHIQETMFNALDEYILEWTNYYNDRIGKENGWDNLDSNMVKSLIFQETQMGTSGEYLDADNFIRTRFNVGQTSDYAGTQQTIMMKEIRSGVYNLELDKAKQKQLDDNEEYQRILKKISNSGRNSLSNNEERNYVFLYGRSDNNRNWDLHLTLLISKNLVTYFKETIPWRNKQYSYWIRTLVRWLFHLHLGASSWESALGKYNSGQPNHKLFILKRWYLAKEAQKNGKQFYPKLHY